MKLKYAKEDYENCDIYGAGDEEIACHKIKLVKVFPSLFLRAVRLAYPHGHGFFIPACPAIGQAERPPCFLLHSHTLPTSHFAYTSPISRIVVQAE